MPKHRARTGRIFHQDKDAQQARRRRASRGRLLEALESRVLLSTTYTSAPNQNFTLTGISLTYTDTSNNSHTLNVSSGDTLAGGTGTHLIVSEPNGTNVAFSTTDFSVGATNLNYNAVTTVQVTGGGTNTLAVSGTGGADTFSVSGSAVSVAGISIGYSSLASLAVNGSGGGDTFNITGDAASLPVTVNTGPGGSTSQINVGNGGTLSGFVSKLTVNGSATDTLTIDDTSVAGAQTGTLTATALTGLDLGASGEVDYSGVGALNINLGSHGNTFTISDTASGTTTGINTGSGIDTLKLVHDSGPTNIDTGSGSSNATPNTVGILATAGTTTVTTHTGDASNIVVGSGAPNPGGVLSGISSSLSITGQSGDALSLFDSADLTGRTATVTGTAVTGLGMGASGVSYSGVGSLGVTLGNIGDTVNVRSTSAPTTITTSNGISTINVGSLAPSPNSSLSTIAGALTIAGNNSDLLNLDDSGGSGHSGVITAGAVSGFTTSPISYSGIATLTVKLGADGLTISGTNTGTATNVTSPAGSDTIAVRAISSPTTITTGGTSNVVTVGSAAGNVDGIGALLTVNGSAGDSLVVNDSGSTVASSVAVSTTSVTIRSAVLHYSGQSNLTVHVGSGGDTVNVMGTAVGITSVIDDAGGADTYTIATDGGMTTVNTGNAGDVVNVQGTGAATFVTTGTGNDAVNVGSAAPAAGGVLDNILGALSVAGGGNTALTIDDTGATTAKTASISGTNVTVGVASITYATVTHLTVNLGSHGNTVSLTGTSAPTLLNSGAGADTVTVTGTSNATTVTAGGGNDTVNIEGVSAALTVNAGLGTDTINVGSLGAGPSGNLAGIGAGLTLSGDALDTLAVDDTGNASAGNGTLTGAAISGLDIGAGSIGYLGFGVVQLALGSAANNLTINGTSGSAVTSVTSKSGGDHVYIQNVGGTTNLTDAAPGASSDLFDVGSLAPTPGGIVNGIQGALTISGAAGGTDTLTVDDTGMFSPETGSLSATTITGLQMASAGITYSAIATLNINLGGLGSGNNFTITGTNASTTTNLHSGAAGDTVNVRAVAGPTNINTDGGTNVVNVGSTAPGTGGVISGIVGNLQLTGAGSSDVVNIDDSGDLSPGALSQSPTSLTIGAATVHFSGFLQVNVNRGPNGSLTIKPAANAVIYNVPAATPANVSVTGTTVTIGAASYSFAGFANVTLNGQIFGNGSDPLTINGTSADENFAISTNSVSFAGTTVFYSTFASLTVYGGGGNDTFTVSGLACPTAVVDGTSSTPGTGTVAFTVNSSGQPLTFTGGNGTDTFNVNGNSGALTLQGLGGTNTFNINGDAGSTTVNGGTAANTYNVTGNSAMIALVGHGTSNNFNINGNSAALIATGAGGTDSFVVGKTTAPITLQAGNGTTTFHITAPTQASVTVAGGSSGTASLIFDGSPVADNFTVTAHAISGALATLNYSAISSITVNGNGGNDTFTVNGDATPTTLNGSTLADTFNVLSFASTLAINTGSAAGTVNLGSNQPGANSVLGALVGTVTVTGNGGDTLNIDDSGDASPQTPTLSATNFALSPVTVAYSHIGTLNVTLGTGGNSVLVSGTAVGTTTNVNTGAGNDAVSVQATGGTTNINTGGGMADTGFVGSTAPAPGGNLSGIQAPLNFTGGGSDALTLDDSGGSVARTGTLSATSLALTGLGAIGYAGVSTLAVNLGSGGNTLTVASTHAGTQTTITNAGSATDTITIVSDSGPTNLDTGGGANTVYVRSTGAATGVTTSAGGTNAVVVGSTAGLLPATPGILDGIQGALTVAGGGAGSLVLDDSGSAIAKTGQLAPGAITGLTMGTSGVAYSGMATLAINLGAAGNTFLIKNTDAVTTVTGGVGSDAITLQNDSSVTTINTVGGDDTVNVQATGGATAVNTGTGTDAVVVGSKAGVLPTAAGILDNIQSALTVTGSGAATTLTLDDTGSSGAKTGTLNDPSITGLGMGASGVVYHSIGSLNINLGSGADTFTIVTTNGGTTTNLGTGPGADTVYVRSTAGPTNVNTGTGTNTVNVGSNDAVGTTEPVATSVLDTIAGPLSITGSASDTLNLDDSATTAGKAFGQLTGLAVTGLSPAAISYSGLANLNIRMGSGSDTFKIAGTAGGTNTSLFTALGNDTVNVQATAAGSQTTVTTGGGSNTVNVGSTAPIVGGTLENLLGQLTVTGNGDVLNLDDTGSALAKTGTLSPTSLTGLGTAGINYSGIATLNLNLGSGADTLLVTGTSPTTTTNIAAPAGNHTINVRAVAAATNITTGGGANIVNVGSTAPAANGNLTGIVGALFVSGAAGDSLALDDTGSGGSQTGQITSFAVTGMGMGASGVAYTGISNLGVKLGGSGNTFKILSTAATVTTTLTSSPTGGDTVNVISLAGPTTVNTGGGGDTVNVSSNAPTNTGNLDGIVGGLTVTGHANDTLNVGDTGSAAQSGTLTASALTGLGMGAPGISYSSIKTLNINLGAGGDTFTIASTSATATNLNTGGGNDTVYVQTTGGATNVNTGSGTNTVLVGSLAPAAGGILDGIAGALTVVGSGLDTLTLDDTGTSSTKTSTLTATTVTGLSPAVITYGGLANLNIYLGFGGNNFTITNTAGTPTAPTTTTYINTGGGNDSLIVNNIGGPTTVDGAAGSNNAVVAIAGDFNSSLTLLNFQTGTVSIGGSFNGSLSTTGSFSTVGVGGNMAGSLTIGGNLGTMTIGRDDSGTITVGGTVQSISIPTAHPTGTSGQVLEVSQGSVQRQVLAVPAAGALTGLNFKLLYDGSAANPQLAIRATNPTPTNRFDLALTCGSTATRFDLSRLDANGKAGLRNVAIDGNLLNTISTLENQYFLYPAGTTGGISVPSDTLAGVGARDNLVTGSIQAVSIMGVAFATLGGVSGSSLNGTGAAAAVTSGTHITLAKDTFRVPFDENAKVTLFGDFTTDAHLNDVPVNFYDRAIDGKGATAIVLMVGAGKNNQYTTQIQSLGFLGDGGSIDTQLVFTGAVTSTGALGDLLFRAGGTVSSLTAASVIGNIDLFGGSVTGTFQTTLGNLGAFSGGAVTTLHANFPAGSKLVSRGSIISKINIDGLLGGTIAAQGDIGYGVVGAGGILTRYGGISIGSGTSTGQIVALGNIIGDITIAGTMNGRIAAKGAAIAGLAATETGILGNIKITSALGSTAAVVSGGLIGDVTQGTSISFGTFSGFVAAIGAIKFGTTGTLTSSRVFQNLAAGSPSAVAINNIWTNGGLPLAFDVVPPDLQGLNLILTDLNALKIGTNGNLTGTTA
ncbi:MAG TPA: hypothetical protein VG269_08405 [Tepidisphaeraceae bacterium]|jgi:hypothetical protein|nr:hypothetical protein [Tepidisphaeraceae bacterium]